MSNVKKCARCGLQSSSAVKVTAMCKKCGASYLLCEKCKPSWKIQKCPSCSAYISSGTWNFLVEEGQGKATEEMSSYLGSYDTKAYIKNWNALEEKRLTQREEDGDTAHRGIPLPAEEVSFLREVEDLMQDPIFTVADDRGSYVVIDDGHVITLRLFNAVIKEKLPESITSLSRMKEFRYEKTDKNKGALDALPETFAECKTLETVILRRTSRSLQFDLLSRLPGLKKLSVQNTLTYSSKNYPTIFSLTSLEELNMRSCVYEPGKLDGIGSMTALKKLNLAWLQGMGGSFSQLPETMKSMENLEELDLTGAKIGQRIYKWPEWLVGLPSLKLLHVNHAQTKNGYDVIYNVLVERNPEAYEMPNLDPAEQKAMSVNQREAWWNQNRSGILKQGWTGVQ